MPLLLCLLLAASARAAGAPLLAAAGKVDITPDLARERVYLAGYGPVGRRAKGAHDRLYARLLVLRQGRETVAVAALDLLGLYREDVLDLRRRAGFDGPGRALVVAAAHTHNGPDTAGLWGPLPGVSGVDERWLDRAKEAIAARLRALEGELRPARLRGASGELDPRGLCRDSRDPQVIPRRVATLAVDGADGRPLATVVNWACHPTVLGWDNRLLTADYPGALCARVEERRGGTCLFLNGPIGGHLEADAAAPTWAEAERIGRAVADAALALRGAESPARALAWRSKTALLPVENPRYRAFLPALARGHRLLDEDGRPLPPRARWTLALRQVFLGLDERAEPRVETEVGLLDAGPARLLLLPGEPFPELLLGGYDGRYAAGRPVLSPGNPAPPALERAPRGPYLAGRLRAPAPMLVGLADDQIGYLVPEYDFKTRPGKTMLPRLPGHYDETNSIGVSATRRVLGAAEALLQENP